MILPCPICSVTTSNKLLLLDPVRKEHFCPACFYKINPPTLILTRPWYSDYFIFPPTGNIVYRKTADFVRCGFHLFNRKVYRNVNANPKAEEILTFFYRGRKRCNLLKKYYSYWLPTMSDCEVEYCF